MDAGRHLDMYLEFAKKRRVPFQVRLVKGAYWDYEVIKANEFGWPIPVFPQKPHTDLTYERLLFSLLQHSEEVKTAVASHNIRSHAYAEALRERLGLPPGTLEHQTLFRTAEGISRAYLTPIMLNRLTRRLAGEMIGRLTGGITMPEEVLSQVAAKSDGVPIFVEELTRMLLESDLLKEVGDHYELTGPLVPLAIPSTLQDSLTARLDRLSSAREVAQLGAVLGREFTYDLIKAVSPLDGELLDNHLQKLVNAEFLYQRGLPPDANYIFKHTLIQDAAYESMLRSNRQQYHRQVAQAMGMDSLM